MFSFFKRLWEQVTEPNKAEVPRASDWQYNYEFFDKVEEFRSDFA